MRSFLSLRIQIETVNSFFHRRPRSQVWRTSSLLETYCLWWMTLASPWNRGTLSPPTPQLLQRVGEQSHQVAVELQRNCWEVTLGEGHLAVNLHWKVTLWVSMWLPPDLIFFSPKGSKPEEKRSWSGLLACSFFRINWESVQRQISKGNFSLWYWRYMGGLLK